MNRLFRIVGILLIAVGATTVASAQITVPGVPAAAAAAAARRDGSR